MPVRDGLMVARFWLGHGTGTELHQHKMAMGEGSSTLSQHQLCPATFTAP